MGEVPIPLPNEAGIRKARLRTSSQPSMGHLATIQIRRTLAIGASFPECFCYQENQHRSSKASTQD